MPRVTNRLNARQVKSLSAPGRYNDGNGLYLEIRESGTKAWLLRTKIDGRQRHFGLGPLRDVTLAEARQKADDIRRKIGAGEITNQDKARAPTFAEAFDRFFAQHSPTWKNPKHRDQWRNTMRDYVMPAIGEMRVDLVESRHIMEILDPIWLEKQETARRVKQRLRTVFDWAIARNHRGTMNPVDAIRAAMPRQTGTQRHHAAMPYDEVPALIDRLSASSRTSPSKFALLFLLHTAARTGEVLGAQWSEIEGDVWTVPAERMKAGREHRVPLTEQAIGILDQVREIGLPPPWCFPGQRWENPLSNMAMTMSLRKHGYEGVTVHGFRSSFRDWAAERTSFPHEVCEAALAHTVGNKVVAAYRRTDLFEKRRELMAAWSRFISGGTGKVVRIRA